MLPQSWCSAGELTRWGTLESILIGRACTAHGPRNSAKAGGCRRVGGPAISEEHRVATHEVHGRACANGQHDVEGNVEIAVLPSGEEWSVRTGCGTVHDGARARQRREGERPRSAGRCATGNFPVGASGTKAVERGERYGARGEVCVRDRTRLGECRRGGECDEGDCGEEVHQGVCPVVTTTIRLRVRGTDKSPSGPRVTARLVIAFALVSPPSATTRHAGGPPSPLGSRRSAPCGR